MSSLFSTLHTGVSGLQASELGTSITSHNIANANDENYTRQRVEQSASYPLHTTYGDVGLGTSVTTIARIHDEFVFGRLRESSADLQYDSYMKNTMEEVSKYFPDLQDAGISNDLQNYFDAWNNFASNPDDLAQKISLVQKTGTLTQDVQNTRNSIREMQDSINDQIKTTIDDANRIGESIADLNKRIAQVESVEQAKANDLRDQRDELEKTLANIMDVEVFKGNLRADHNADMQLTDAGTSHHINVGGHTFVDGPSFHPLVVESDNLGNGYYSIYTKDESGGKTELSQHIHGGKIGAMLDLRGRTISGNERGGYPDDGILQDIVDNMDAFATTLIENTNNIYASAAQDNMTSKPNKELRDNTRLTEYSPSLNSGTFDIVMYDEYGKEAGRKTITINETTTINDNTLGPSIVDQINASTDDNNDNNSLNDIDEYFRAAYTYDTEDKEGTFSIYGLQPESGYQFSIDDNGTNFAGVTGLSTFFAGDDASDIDIEQEFKDDPIRLKAGKASIEGNNEMANDMIQLQYDTLNFNSGYKDPVDETIEGYYRYVATNVASTTERAGTEYDTQNALFNTINVQYQSVSGVNVDEELTNLMKYQTSYGANAQVITTVDEMMNTLLGLKR